MKYQDMILDYETRSEVDLKTVGLRNYMLHPSTELLCVGYYESGKEPKIITYDELIADDYLSHLRFLELLASSDTRIIAHNSMFEVMATLFLLPKYFRSIEYKDLDFCFESLLNMMTCTASRARAKSYPGDLEGACLAAKSPFEKNMNGRKVMLKLTKPRKPTKTNPNKFVNDEEAFQELYQYCKDDLIAEAWLHGALPELTPKEREVWMLDQRMNYYGMACDVDSCTTILKHIDEYNTRLLEELCEITDRTVTSAKQTAKFTDFLVRERVYLPNLQAATVLETLKRPNISAKARRALEIRKDLGLASVAKYETVFDQANAQRLFDYLCYHAASTGRWGGRGFQPQNLPKGKVKKANELFDIVNDATMTSREVNDTLTALYGNPLDVYSSMIRGIVRASPGHVLHVADYNAIEARVLAWFAGEEALVKAFREGVDLYIEEASFIYNKKPKDVTDQERQLGKAVILGCGYQMGADRFYETCLLWGIKVDKETATKAVELFREKYSKIKMSWGIVERAAIEAVTKKTSIKALHVTFTYDGVDLWCELPSGRKLCYPFASVKVKTTSWGESKFALHYWGVDSKTKKWCETSGYGGKLVENIIQAISRDCMVEGKLEVVRQKFLLLASIHDEVLAETLKDHADLARFEKALVTMPAWAKDIPLKAKGFLSERYQK